MLSATALRSPFGVRPLRMTARSAVANRVIAGLPNTERVGLLECCEKIELGAAEVLCRQHEPYSHVWFPLTAIVSVTASVANHPPMGVGIIGCEGVLGCTLILAVSQAPHRAIVQGPGSALQISRVAFGHALADSPALLHSLQRYSFRLMVQMAGITLCTRFHLVEARLARWLLMTHDRTDKDDFYLTHQFLGELLGVRRSAVTLASGTLRQAGLIGYSRGRISILDRSGLEAAACECYTAGNFKLAD